MPRAGFIQDALTRDVKSQRRNAVKDLGQGTVQVTRAGKNDQIVYELMEDGADTDFSDRVDAYLSEGDYGTAEEVFEDTGYRPEEIEGEIYIVGDQ